MYQTNKRRMTASTKTRGEVRGGGAKPWRQKGTGRARHGSIRSPIWRGGGVVFGPKPRDVKYKMPQKKRILGLVSALNSRINEQAITVLDKLELPSFKTKEFMKILKNLDIKRKALFVDNDFSQNVKWSSRNIPNIELVRQQDLNAYWVLLYPQVVITEQAFKDLEARIKKVLNRG